MHFQHQTCEFNQNNFMLVGARLNELILSENYELGSLFSMAKSFQSFLFVRLYYVTKGDCFFLAKNLRVNY